MFRRLRLPGKMAIAVVPLVLAVVAAGVLLVLSELRGVEASEQTAEAANVIGVLPDVIAAIDNEATASLNGNQVPARERTDETLARFSAEIADTGSVEAVAQYDLASSALGRVRTAVDRGLVNNDEGRTRVAPQYEAVASNYLTVSDIILTEVASPEVARSLRALDALVDAQATGLVQRRLLLGELQTSDAPSAVAARANDQQDRIDQSLGVFRAVADDEFLADYEFSDIAETNGRLGANIDRVAADPELTIAAAQWQSDVDSRTAILGNFVDEGVGRVTSAAADSAGAARQAAYTLIGITVGVLLLTLLATGAVARSIVTRVRSITERARQVAQEQLPALVAALRDPSEDSRLPELPPIRDRGADEVGDLARSFAAMQTTLEQVAEQQHDTLRRGVAEMFVTMARRNRSLIDRQLSLLDRMEESEEDSDLLAEYYRLDHLATRMRRNAESLLVLAGEETQRSWQDPVDVDDVVRAAIGEIEDYRRVDVLALEPVRLKGSVIADMSHLLSELLENATAFSPPQSRVRVAGHFDAKGYLVTITDRGVGLPNSKLAEFNGLLERPPIVGLALEPTLGLYVVAMLAKRHGIKVRLVPGAPGVTAQILVPPSRFEVSHDAPRQAQQPAPSMRPEQVGMQRRRTVEADPTPPREHAVRARPSVTPPAVAPTPEAPAASVAPVPHDRTEAGLPARRPGTSFVDATPDRPVGAAESPDEVRSSLGSFQAARERHNGEGDGLVRYAAADNGNHDRLPSRVPGSAFDGADEERPVATADPESIRSSLGSFQTGIHALRKRHDDESTHGGNEEVPGE